MKLCDLDIVYVYHLLPFFPKVEVLVVKLYIIPLINKPPQQIISISIKIHHHHPVCFSFMLVQFSCMFHRSLHYAGIQVTRWLAACKQL